MSFKYFIKLVYLVVIIISAPLTGAEFHALLVGDTTDSSIGRSCRNDIKNMQDEVSRIASYSGLKLHLVILQGTDATTKNVLKYINELKPSSDDVVFFYNSSHGFHTTSQQDPWPNIYLGQSREGINFESINELLYDKGPRLLISFADACNNTFKDDEAPPLLMAKRLPPQKEDKKKLKKSYQHLFLESSGVIIASASKAGKYSYSYMTKGSLFTFAFLDAMKDEVKNASNPSWLDIMSKTVSNTMDRASILDAEQEPQFIIAGNG